MEEIDERIRLKAGNAVADRKPAVEVQQTPATKPEESTEKKAATVQSSDQQKASTEKKPEFGQGITAEQIDKIVREFQK